MTILLQFLPLILKIALPALDYFFERNAHLKAEREWYLKMVDGLRKNGNLNVRSRFEAEDGKKAADDEWTKIENQETQKKEKPNG